MRRWLLEDFKWKVKNLLECTMKAPYPGGSRSALNVLIDRPSSWYHWAMATSYSKSYPKHLNVDEVVE